MITIHKQKIQIADTQTIKVPAKAEFLSAQMQRDALCIWYLCDDKKPLTTRMVCVVGTGHDASRVTNMKHINTFQVEGHGLVFHVFVEG